MVLFAFVFIPDKCIQLKSCYYPRFSLFIILLKEERNTWFLNVPLLFQLKYPGNVSFRDGSNSKTNKQALCVSFVK